jgi:quercetin dioxygenase-like cupin family protein
LNWLLDALEPLEPPTGQALSRPALERLVTQVATRPEIWEAQIDRDCTERMYACLHRDAQVDVWAIFWRPGNDTGWHDHDTSSGAVHVVEGTLTEYGLRVGGPELSREYRAGDRFSFDPSHIHRLTCEQESAVSIHAYSAPLWRLGQYSLDSDGALHRVSVTYADELRPLELAAS